MADPRSLLQREMERIALRPFTLDGFYARRDRKRRNQRIAAGVVALAVFAVPIALFAGLISSDRTQTPGGTEPRVPAVPEVDPAVPEVDYLLDLNTGEMNPLPRAILRSLGPDVGRGPFPESPGQYAASPDGSRLAYVGIGDGGSLQIYTSGIDGTGVRQVTHEPIRAITPAWSPDGTRIAYFGYGGVDAPNIFVLELATGQSKQVTDESPIEPYALQFTPDGSSILFTGGPLPNTAAELRTVPVTGGKSTLLFDPQARGFGHTGQGSLSPDGSLVTFMGHRIGGPGAIRFVTNADGTDWRSIGEPCRYSNPAGTWSPDGSRIVCSGIRVTDIATGHTTRVANGQVAIWLDGHTLLVEV